MDGRRSICRKQLHQAVRDGRVDDVKRLLPTRPYIDLPNSSGRTALYEACVRGNALVAHVLLNGGANVNCTDHIGSTLLHVACELGSTSLVDVLLHHGATVNKRRRGAVTPLYLACKAGFVAIVKALIEHGADVNLPRGQDSGSETPLHAAVSRGHVEVVEILLRHGARVDVVDHWGWTALHMACAKGYLKVVEALMDHGASVNARAKFVKDQTPLHLAALNGHVKVADILLQCGASIDKTDCNGQSALHVAIENERNAKSALRVHCNAVFDLLLSRGASFDVRDARGETPLRAACWDRNTPIVHTLLSLGAKPINVVVEMGNCLDYWSTVLLAKLDDATLSLVLDFSPSIGFCTEEHTVRNRLNLSCSGVPRICLYSTLFNLYLQENLIPTYERHFIKAYAAEAFSPNFAGASSRFVQGWNNMLAKPFLAECEREVEIMKILLIPGTEATYHDILLQKHSRKWSLVALKELSIKDCDARFPIYGKMIHARFLALQKYLLASICQDIFYLTDPPLPLEVSRKIVNYLPIIDLLNLVEILNKTKQKSDQHE